MKVVVCALVALTFMAMTSIIAADNKTISWKNWTEEKIVSLFRTFGENFCARTDVCDNNRSNQPTLSNSSELAPCCEDCYCDDDCENYNDCCFKSVYSTEQNEDEECLYQSSDKNIDIVNAKVAFYMVTSCNKTINCYDLQQNPWGPLLPVFSPSRQKIYINNQCATCNRVTDGQEWNSYMKFNSLSSSDIDTIFSAIRLRTFTASCHAHFRYPYDDIGTLRKLQCFKNPPVDACPNKTSLRANILQYLHQFNLDQNSITELCSSSYHSVYVHTDTKSMNYYIKNVFCFICNKNMIPSNACLYESKYPFKQISNINFVMLVKWTHGVAYVDGLPLKSYEIKNENNHRKIHCPVGQERNPQGECINALTKWPSQEVGLFVKLLISEPIRLPNGTTAEGIKQFFNGIDFHIETSMGFQLLAEYAHYITESDFAIIDYFAIVFRILKSTNPPALLSQIHQFLKSNWTVRFNDTLIKCKQELMSHSIHSLSYLNEIRTKHDLEFLKGLYNLVSIDSYSPIFRKTILSNMLLIGKIFSCPLVEFAEEEVHLMYDRYVLYIAEYATHFGDMEFVTSIDINGNGTVKVCWDDTIFYDLKLSVLVNSAINCQISFMCSIAYILYRELRYNT